MSPYSSNPPSLAGQDPPGDSDLQPNGSSLQPYGSTVLTNGSSAAASATAASHPTTTHSLTCESQDHTAENTVVLHSEYTQFHHPNAEYGVDLTLLYNIKEQGCEWKIKLKRTSGNMKDTYVGEMVSPGLFLDDNDIKQKWKDVKMSEEDWHLIRETLWDANKDVSDENRPFYVEKITEAQSHLSAEKEYAGFDSMAKEGPRRAPNMGREHTSSRVGMYRFVIAIILALRNCQ